MLQCPKKLILTGPAHLERPFRSFHNEILKWNDYWLKGMDTGIMDEPPVRYWLMGANEWRSGQDWPLPEARMDQILPAQLGAPAGQPGGRSQL